MINKFFKRGIALFVCLSLVLTIYNVSIAKANTINESLLGSNATIFNEDIANDPEVIFIDNLAKEYYNYYVENGVTQEDVKEIAKSTSIETPKGLPMLSNGSIKIINSINPISSVLSDAALDYSYYIKQVTGNTYNFNQIASQLASLGILMKLASPLPFLDLLALVAGGIILTLAIAIVYSAIAVGVNDVILTWYQYSSVNLTAAKQNTIAIVAQHNNGAKYWKAYLANYGGLGGIMIGDPITYYVANQIVLQENMYNNVFAFNYSDAAYLATYAYGNGFSGPEAHRHDGKLFNMQHVHARKANNGPGNCHIFFAAPSIV